MSSSELIMRSFKVRHEMEQECARKSENNDGLEQQLKVTEEIKC